MEALIGLTARTVIAAMTRGASTFLYLDNPSTCYNPDHVAGVTFKTFGPEDFQRQITHVQKEALGFKKGN